MRELHSGTINSYVKVKATICVAILIGGALFNKYLTGLWAGCRSCQAWYSNRFFCCLGVYGECKMFCKMSWFWILMHPFHPASQPSSFASLHLYLASCQVWFRCLLKMASKILINVADLRRRRVITHGKCRLDWSITHGSTGLWHLLNSLNAASTVDLNTVMLNWDQFCPSTCWWV